MLNVPTVNNFLLLCLVGLFLTYSMAFAQSGTPFSQGGIEYLEKLKVCQPHRWEYNNPFGQGGMSANVVHGKVGDKCIVDFYLPGRPQILHCSFSAGTVVLQTSDKEFERVAQGRLDGSTDSPLSKAMNDECNFVDPEKIRENNHPVITAPVKRPGQQAADRKAYMSVLATPAAAIEPLILESLDVSENGPRRTAPVKRSGQQAADRKAYMSVLATPAAAIEPLILESLDVSENGPRRTAIELILDVSGSMAGRIQNETKIQIALRALRDTLRDLKNPVFLVGLRAYGFDASVPKTAEASCPNTELLTDIASNNSRDLLRQALDLTPYGYTPIAESLRQAAKDLQAVEAEDRMIILITDGEETCGGDPKMTAKTLCAMGIDLETHVVGFDLEPNTAATMRQVAAAGCGTYVDAKNARELTDGLSDIVTEARNKIDPAWLRSIHPVEGGGSFDTAVPITTGTYTLTRFLAKHEHMFFRVNTDIAQHGVLRGLVQAQRLIRKGGLIAESSLGYSQFRLTLYLPGYDPRDPDTKTKKRRRRLRLAGKPGTYKSIGYHDIVGDGFVFSISSPYDRVHADSLFSVGIRESGDIYEGYDAPATYGDRSISLRHGTPVVAHLGEGDMGDLFVLPDTSAETLIEVDLANPEFSAKIELFTQDGKRLDRTRGTGNQVSIAVPAGATPVMLLVSSTNPYLRQQFTSYIITATVQ